MIFNDKENKMGDLINRIIGAVGGTIGGNSSNQPSPSNILTPEYANANRNVESYRAGGNIFNYAGDVIGTYQEPGLSDSELAQQERDADAQYAANQAAAQKTADERGYYQSQIDALNNLLGYIDTSKTKGLESLGASYADQVARANKVYSDQELANQKAKLGGIEQVDQYAGQNYNSLMSLLRNAGAGSSSVARDLMPSLVARAAGTRRQNVFNTAGENQAAIDTARTYGLNDIENKRKSAEESFLSDIGNRQINALGQRSNYELQRDMADGTGYDAARAASDATQAGINSRYNELASLFDKYKPTYSAIDTPDMAKYTADKAAIKVGGGQSDPSMYYSNLFKKKQEQGL